MGVALFIALEREVEGIDAGAVEWFHAEEGLKTIDLLLQHTQSQKPGENALLRDLRDAKQVLERARDNNVRFHFAVDF